MGSIDWHLIQKYDKPGPRYTSYPTAPLFSTDVGADAMVAHLAAANRGNVPLSLYVHLPFCRSLCWYCGCNMKVSRNRDVMQAHLRVIKQEVESLRRAIAPHRKTCQVHLGGGTPNYLLDEDLLDLMRFLKDTFPLTDDAEISMEVDPRQVTPDQVRAIKACGFNRVSMGVQDFDPTVQAAINRIQPYDMVAEGVAAFRAAGLDALNMDLIYGLPKQTLEGFAATVDKVIDLSPARIALFNYAYVPALKPHMKLIHPEDLPRPEVKFQLLQRTIEQLTDAGYVYIGMDHFAKPDDPLCAAMNAGTLHRNFQGYTTHAESEMLAFGMSAISMFDGLYVQNAATIEAYEAAVTEGRPATWRGYVLHDEDRLRRGIINDFMCRTTIEPERISRRAGRPFDEVFPGVRAQLDDMVADGLLTTTPDGWQATFLGRLLMRNVAMLFDAYLPEMIAGNKARFSRTV